MTYTGYTRQALSVLIEEYEKHACLYSTKNRNYHNKVARNAAIDSIRLALLPLRPGTTENDIKSKINTCRTTYISEKRKILMKKGQGGKVYEPSLWYYSKLKFLDDYIDVRPSVNKQKKNVFIEFSECNEDISRKIEEFSQLTEVPEELLETSPLNENDIYSRSPSLSPEPSMSNIHHEKKRKLSDNDLIKHTIGTLQNLESTVGINTQTSIPEDVFGTFIASRLKKLQNSVVKLRVEHAILDIIQQAEIEELGV